MSWKKLIAQGFYSGNLEVKSLKPRSRFCVFFFVFFFFLLSFFPALERQVRGNVYFSPASPRIITSDLKLGCRLIAEVNARSRSCRVLGLLQWETLWCTHFSHHHKELEEKWKWIFCIWQNPRLLWSCVSPIPFQDCFQNPFLSCF